MPRHGLVHGPSCPCICQVCTALPDEALGRWLEPGSQSVKPNRVWVRTWWGRGWARGVLSHTHAFSAVCRRRGLSGQQMGLQGTSQGCATSQSREPGPPRRVQGGAG